MGSGVVGQLVSGCAHVHSEAELAERLRAAADAGRPLRVKLGMDPTAPDLHLGHSVVLRKMRQFQDLGHTAVLVIGDFTARIGDPTGRNAIRPPLSPAQIDAYARTYLDQAGRILLTSAGRLEVHRNADWFDAMPLADLIRLAARSTLGRMLQRDDFRTRYEANVPVHLHELLYPLLQGWDSVKVRADVELGGTDQLYNNFTGRELQAEAGQPPQVILLLPLLRGLDGAKKMSKSVGNHIALLDQPRDVFGKTMSIPDDLLLEWFALLTDVPAADYEASIARDPMAAKRGLARKVGELVHTPEAMAEAERWWHERFSMRRAAPPKPLRVSPDDVRAGLPAWKLAWLAHDARISRSEARRMVKNGAVEYDGRKILDPHASIAIRDGAEFRAGRHRAGEHVKQPLVGVIALGG